MTELVDVQTLSLPDLRSLVLQYQGLVQRLLETVRREAKPEWRLRREVEGITQHYQPLLDRAYHRGVESTLEQLVVERRAHAMDATVWGRFADSK